MAADEPNGGTGPKLGLRLVEVVGYGALVAMILASVYRARAVRVDVTHEMSSSKAFGAFLNAAPSYRDAILVPEPDYYIESLLYYAHNPIYLARERRFGNTVAWSSAASAADLSLGQLVWARPGCFTTSASPGAPGSARTPSGRGAGRGVLGCVQ